MHSGVVAQNRSIPPEEMWSDVPIAESSHRSFAGTEAGSGDGDDDRYCLGNKFVPCRRALQANVRWIGQDVFATGEFYKATGPHSTTDLRSKRTGIIRSGVDHRRVDERRTAEPP